MSSIRFYFEFASPYSYLASLEIEQVAAGARRPVEWCPIDIVSVWTAHGVLDAYMAIRRLKRPYIARDSMRCAELRGVALAKPSVPARNTATAKLAYWGLHNTDPQVAKRFLQLVWHRYFGQGHPIDGLDDLAKAATEIGLGASEIEAAAAWAGAREAQAQSNSDAVRSGCFGVPWFVVDGEPFFGHDRLDHLAAHIGSPG